MSAVGRAWRGEEKLWVVFWIYGVLAAIVIGILIDFIDKTRPISITLGLIFLLLIYIVWITVSQWRCAFNAKWKFWGYLVRILIVLNIVLVVGGMALGFLGTGSDLLKGAKCRKAMRIYAASQGIDYESYKVQHPDELKKCIASSSAENEATSNAVPAEQAEYYQQCEKVMTDNANKNNVDPQKYIAQNQAYLQQCVQYYKDSKKAP